MKIEQKKIDIKDIVIFSAIIGVLFLIFQKPFIYMVIEWKNRLYTSYTPGPFVPVVSAYIIWLKKDVLKKLPIQQNLAGIFLIVFALVLHILAQRGDLQRISIVAFIIILLGIVLFLLGKKFLYELAFPIIFLIFMVPMEFLDGMIGVPLRIFAAKWAAAILDILGFELIRTGTQINMIGIFRFDVAAPCSGLKSLVSLTALSFAFAYLSQKENWKRLVIIAFAIPIALIANVCRIIMLGLIAVVFGKEAALGCFHGFSGFFLFTFALLALTGIGKLLSWHGKKLV